MALFEVFPNYIWNLSVAISVASGAELGEIVDMCEPIKRAADEGADAGTPQFLREWVKKADTLIELANEDLERGRKLSAASKLRRASLYLITAERMQSAGQPEKALTFEKAQTAFKQYVDYSG
ncbi:alpha/beta hydrolase, partial [Gammaproteobacteria bacterium]|nr:alpha/beta hydrolase [Gammaproteobacteria bacterium]